MLACFGQFHELAVVMLRAGMPPEVSRTTQLSGTSKPLRWWPLITIAGPLSMLLFQPMFEVGSRAGLQNLPHRTMLPAECGMLYPRRTRRTSTKNTAGNALFYAIGHVSVCLTISADENLVDGR